MSNYETIIGLEVHCQLKTRTKIFSSDPYSYGQEANSQAGPITLALPGSLPTLNRSVLEMAIKAALALSCQIAPITRFDRKHYFYPDLPKGYQISQYDMPYATNGVLLFSYAGDKSFAGDKSSAEGKRAVKVAIRRIHMEEDAGKLLHASNEGKNCSYVDLNRAGAPLLEIVTEPDLRSAQDAALFLQNLKNILRAIEVTDANMEEGSLRCDANVSVRRGPDAPLGTRVEVKNLNSFKAVRAAIEYESQRQIDILEEGGEIIQATALWDADRRETRLMRTKEDAEDYRYFPDPDLLPIAISEELLKRIQADMPELPAARKERYIRELKLPEYDAELLAREKEVAEYFENTYKICKDAKKSSNWVKDEVLGVLNKTDQNILNFRCTAGRLGKMIRILNEGAITSRMAKQIFEHIYKEDLEPEQVMEKYNYRPMDAAQLTKIIDKVFADNQQSVRKILGGNQRVKGHLVGEVMRITKGKAPPREVNQLIDTRLNNIQLAR